MQIINYNYSQNYKKNTKTPSFGTLNAQRAIAGTESLLNEAQAVGHPYIDTLKNAFNTVASKFTVYDDKDLERIINAPTSREYYEKLKNFIPESIYKAPKGKKQNIVLMGCGGAFEGAGVNSFFSGNPYGQISHDVKIYGIDLFNTNINRAKQHFNNFPQFIFFNNNNLDLPNIEQIPKELDVVTFKHPYIDKKDVNDFTTMIKQAHEALRKGGLIISNFLTSDDKGNFERALQNLNIKPLINKDLDATIIVQK